MYQYKKVNRKKVKSGKMCFFCKQEGVKTHATFRTLNSKTGSGIFSLSDYACGKHVKMLPINEKKEQAESSYKDDKLTEADYQTWYYL